MAINIESIKKGLQQAIKSSPTNITLMRENQIDDGYGGTYLDKDNPYIIVFNEDIYLNELGSSKGSTSYTEGGKVESINGVTALVPIGNYSIEEGDFFVKDNKKYIIKFFILVYKAYWSVDLEVSDNGVK